MDSRNTVITEEPCSGWLRIEVEGEKPYYKTPVPRTVIRDKAKLNSYLDKEHAKNRMLDIQDDKFSFKRRLGLRNKRVSENEQRPPKDITTKKEPDSIVERLTKSGKVINHRQLL